MVYISNIDGGFIETFSDGVVDMITCRYTGECIINYKGGRVSTLSIPCSSFNQQYGVIPSLCGSMIFVSYWDKGLTAYNAENGEKLWSISGRKFTSVIAYESHLVAMRYGNAVLKINMYSGEILLEIKSSTIEKQFELGDGSILVNSVRGKLTLFDSNLNPIKQYRAKEVNPYDCLSLVIRKAYLQNNELYISGFEEYPHMNYDNQGQTAFVRMIDNKVYDEPTSFGGLNKYEQQENLH